MSTAQSAAGLAARVMAEQWGNIGVTSEPPLPANRLEHEPPRLRLWIFHIEEGSPDARMWTTTVHDVGRRSAEQEVRFGSEDEAVAHLRQFIGTAYERSMTTNPETK